MVSVHTIAEFSAACVIVSQLCCLSHMKVYDIEYFIVILINWISASLIFFRGLLNFSGVCIFFSCP